MPESVPRILRLLQLAARRAAWLSFARGAALAVAACAAGLAVATLAVNEGARSTGLLALAITVVAALGLGWWRLRGLRPRIAIRGQAEAVEALRPELRGGLLAVVDRAERPLGGSPGLLARLADDVARRIEGLTPRQIWPGRPLWNDVRWGVLASLVLTFVAIRSPLGPLDALALVLGAPAAGAAVTPVQADGPHAMLGDITLRYEYPTYTRLEPLEVPNTSGEVHAPPGTRVTVRARTAEPTEAAFLEVSGAEPVPATVTGGRAVAGQFTVAAEGTWRFRFDTLSTVEYRILPDPDLAPVVAVKAAATMGVTLDQPVPISFSAKDDYGITKVVLELTVNGRVREEPLRVPIDAPRTLSDQPDLTPASLGLRSGDVAKVRVGAWDNDEVSGSKVGWSSVFVLEVGGSRGTSESRRELRKQLLDTLIPVLADFLVDPSPPATAPAELAAWSDRADERYAAFDVAAEAGAGLDARTFEARQIDKVNGARRDLLAFIRGLPEGGMGSKDAETLASLQAANVRALEMAVWSLDRKMRMEAYEALKALVEQLAQEAKELKDDLPALTPAQALARLDQLARLQAQVRAAAAKLDRGAIRTFLDSRGSELDDAMAAARRDIAANDEPAAKADLQRIADLLEEMAGGVEEAQKRGSGEDEALKKDIEALKKELDSLAADQSALQKKTDAARDRHGQSLEKGLAAWKKVDAAAAEVEKALGDPSVEPGTSSRPYASAAEDAKHDADGVQDSVRARDAQTSLERAGDLRRSIERARSRLQQAVRGGQMSGADAARADAALDRASRAASTAESTLEELAAAQGEASPELAKALRELSGEQRELAERAKGSAERARRVAQGLPSDASELQSAADEGAEQAKRAGQAMDEGEAMAASGAQQAAEDAFERAQDALEQALREAQEMQTGGGGEPTGEGEPQSGDQDGGEGPGRREFTLPAPEEFETPEAYRKALLEGMQGDVPEAYRAANHRYYEELVRQ